MEPVDLALLGCGSISDRYAAAAETFDVLRIAACADLEPKRAEAKADEHDIPRACTPEELFDDPGVDVVVNLTPPAVHAEVTLQALEAGTHVYTEKPFAASTDEGREILETADERDLLVGGAPDTFLGVGFQTCRAVLDEGRIGEPVGAVASWGSSGHEHWHPDPELFYRRGGGPMFDMGPYYVTALVSLLGPVESAAGSTRTPRSQRTITSEPKTGKTIDVEVPTHEIGVVNFERGVSASVQMSFDVHAIETGGFEIYGTDGTLSLPNPNGFSGPVRVYDAGADDWEEVPLTHDHTGHRGLGVVDLARTLRTDWKHRASGDLAHHVLEILEGVRTANDEQTYVETASSCDRPAPLPRDFDP